MCAYFVATFVHVDHIDVCFGIPGAYQISIPTLRESFSQGDMIHAMMSAGLVPSTHPEDRLLM